MKKLGLLLFLLGFWISLKAQQVESKADIAMDIAQNLISEQNIMEQPYQLLMADLIETNPATASVFIKKITLQNVTQLNAGIVRLLAKAAPQETAKKIVALLTGNKHLIDRINPMIFEILLLSVHEPETTSINNLLKKREEQKQRAEREHTQQITTQKPRNNRAIFTISTIFDSKKDHT